ncbi:hypothetical protein [Amycolatopsis sp. H20-H5]|uniref:hypothetical protein n=1 Tax=Amycolatopsis sp. H20-H5 TaxID=3046309 RepID=UPI002DB8489B|nr:hypothetical protein [Amycolatopsis sp. H20-H5]MEC3978953.1 hypothetical protein [Amycolatopsis sp. H20-H5]
MPGRSAQSARFFGGPLDGRVQELGDAEPVPGTVLRHVHLHDGPKIETHYELGRHGGGWEYRLCAMTETDGESREG